MKRARFVDKSVEYKISDQYYHKTNFRKRTRKVEHMIEEGTQYYSGGSSLTVSMMKADRKMVWCILNLKLMKFGG